MRTGLRATIAACALAIVVGGAAGCSDGSADDEVISVERVAELPDFGEGPVFDADGRFFVSDPFNSRVLLVDAEGEFAPWASVEQPNGHKVVGDGTHVVQTPAGPLRLDADGTPLGLVAPPDPNAPFLTPNDLTPDRMGGFWFTDPGRFGELDPGRLFHVDASGTASLAADGLFGSTCPDNLTIDQ